MSASSAVVRLERIAVAPHGDQVVVRCRKTRNTLILGPKEARLVAQCATPRHIDDLKTSVRPDFSGRDVEKLVVLLRDLGVLRSHHAPAVRQHPWSFRIITIPLSGIVRHRDVLRLAADAISAGGITAALASAWLIAHNTPQVLTSLLNQDYLSRSSLLAYLLSILIIGFFHESSHAVTIKARGGHVFETGFFLIFLIPAFYVDATGIRMIRSKAGRIQAWCAGLCMQAILLLACLLVLVYLPETPSCILDFALFSSCVNVAMVLANLLPIIRLDGYRVFCELVGVEDLITTGAAALLNQSVPGRADPLRRSIAVFFTTVTVILVPSLGTTAASLTLPEWTGISLDTFALTISVLMPVGVVAALVIRARRSIRRGTRHA